AVFDGRGVKPHQMTDIYGSLAQTAKEPLVRVNRLTQ
ncbi:YdeI family stress tolerance OB fold protein, partial [Salmonella enterica]